MHSIYFFERYSSGLMEAFDNCGFKFIKPTEDYYEIKSKTDKLSWIENMMCKENCLIEYLFTFDFDINVSKWCYEHNIIYISWIVDSPHISLYSEISNFPTNRIFVFDRYESDLLINSGRSNIRHFPLATDVKLLHEKAMIDIPDSGRFKQDVSFMGNLYLSQPHDMYDRIEYLPDYLKGYLDALIEAQTNIWGLDLFKTEALYAVMPELKKYIKIELVNNYHESVYSVFLDSIIGRKVTQIERVRMCKLLSRKYDFTLYSGSDTSFDDSIRNNGYINYINEMPYMFKNTKININLNMHCITTGIPLRILDIMACEGFCMTNYQSELTEYFIDGEDLVIYSDFDDMCDKIDYYLKHESERLRIANNGYKKTRDMFDYSVVVPRILEMI